MQSGYLLASALDIADIKKYVQETEKSHVAIQISSRLLKISQFVEVFRYLRRRAFKGRTFSARESSKSVLLNDFSIIIFKVYFPSKMPHLLHGFIVIIKMQ